MIPSTLRPTARAVLWLAAAGGALHAGPVLAASGTVSDALARSAVVAGPAAEAVVGRVSLLIGDARVVRRGGQSEPLRRGAGIQVGDRVETSANGHVHLRFIDNAAVSVRPESVLEVQAYRYDASQPRLNEVRLHVEKGISRSISGQATEVDKNRFRLNTPLAAIGVRGTDFIVQTSDTSMRASVAEGAIVVGALGGGCTAAGLGPCAEGQTSLLSADMGRLMVEVHRGEQTARLVPLAGHALVAGQSPIEDRTIAQRTAETNARTAGMAAGQTFQQNDQEAAGLLTIAAASVPPPNAPPESGAQLAWGRYTFLPASNDKVSQLAVLAARGRDAAVGTSDFTLFRTHDAANPDHLLTSNEAAVSFRLSRGQATFESAAGAVEAATLRGQLTLDFSQRTFSTALDLSSPNGGSAELRVAGSVRADGVFSVGDPGASRHSREVVIGAVTADGKEAGYLFERGTVGGLFRGKTLWGR